MNNVPYTWDSGASCSLDPLGPGLGPPFDPGTGPGIGPPLPPGGFCWDDGEMGALPMAGPGGGGGSGPGNYTGGQVIWPPITQPPCNPIP
jgi:hypothetical protein